MNPPQVYTCSLSCPPPSSFLPPHTIPLGRPSALAPSIQYRALFKNKKGTKKGHEANHHNI